jgi:hypothetical protein
MPRNARVSFAVTLVVSLVLIAFACNQEKSNNETSTSAAKPQVVLGAKLAIPAVTVTLPPPGQPPVFPGDTPVPAPTASLTQAATFAWQEFIAATWPAQPAGNTFNRDVPDPNGVYGATAGTPTGAPLVWETFRHKVEIFPGTTSANYMQQAPPHGLNLNAPDLGYNDPPQYNYATYPTAQVTGACNPNDPNNATTAWVNADENSQIFLDTMYAGVLGPTGTQPSPSQEILFLAKGNHVHYQYVVNPKNFGSTNIYDGIWNHFGPGTSGETSTPVYNTAVANFATYQKAVLAKQPATLQSPYVSFPPGTVEAKSAWRPLTATESGPCTTPNSPTPCRFHMAMVRMYQTTASGAACYQQSPWGMIALHIIQKTPTAPYFIYATFSQADNILDSNGKPVEDADGTMINPNPGPNLDSGYPVGAQNPVVATMATATTFETYNVGTTSAAPAKCAAGSRLYLVNSSGGPSSSVSWTPQGPICVNQRTHPIPQTIISVNQAAHAAITTYNAANNGGKSTPWLFYKLVNVQAAPINKPTPGTVYNGADSATYYQSNDVVETNYNLQFFSGRLVSATGGLLMSDFTTDPSNPPSPTNPANVFQNVFYLQTPNGAQVSTFNMGGCMGCHGNAQQAADDFSFILNVGRDDAPEPLPTTGATAAAQPAAVAAKARKFTLPQAHYNLPK